MEIRSATPETPVAVDEQKASDEALCGAEQRLRLALAAGQDLGSWEWDHLRPALLVGRARTDVRTQAGVIRRELYALHPARPSDDREAGRGQRHRARRSIGRESPAVRLPRRLAGRDHPLARAPVAARSEPDGRFEESWPGCNDRRHRTRRGRAGAARERGAVPPDRRTRARPGRSPRRRGTLPVPQSLLRVVIGYPTGALLGTASRRSISDRSATTGRRGRRVGCGQAPWTGAAEGRRELASGSRRATRSPAG